LNRFLSLLRLEYDLIWSLPFLGVVYVMMFAAFIAGHGDVTAGVTSNLQREGEAVYLYAGLGGSYYYSSVFLVVFTSYVYSKSLAGQISNGFIKTIMSYPIGRTRLLLAKLLSNYLFLLVAGLLPALYSQLLWNVRLEILGVLVTAYSVKLLFYSSLVALISLLAGEPMTSLVGSILILFALEAAPSFFWSIKIERAARIINAYTIATGLYEALRSRSWLEALVMSDALATIAVYTISPAVLIMACLYLFKRMDLD